MNSSRLPRAAAAEPSLPAPSTTASTSSFTSAAIKRPAPSLLPAFEPLSSSPGLPRPTKRLNTGLAGAQLKYPTPVPTSSTGIMSSSPPRRHGPVHNTAPERAPLSAVPSVELNVNGDTLLMGRSSNSSHFQLSGNRLVSRVHVRARYVAAASPLDANRIEISCHGWNGLKLHCQGRSWELFKGDSFTSETDGTEIMVDVLDARVMIQWPKRASTPDTAAHLSDSSWDDSPPRSRAHGNSVLQSSPLRRAARIASPESPTLASAGHLRRLSSAQRLRALLPDDDDASGIHIYEDEPELPVPKKEENIIDVGVSMRTDVTASFSSDADEADEHDPDEENDPIVHSFGPFGADISGRLASISTKSPRALLPAKRLVKSILNQKLAPTNIKTEDVPKPLSKENLLLQHQPEEHKPTLATTTILPEEQEQKPETPLPSVEVDPAISNHVVNQLAFSRVSSTPLSTIMQNLPANQTKGLTAEALRLIIEATASIGTIARQGKDAAGKALESQYYYVPEKDDDPQRRAAVVDGLRKPSLRNCRKQHKQYYWKRPRTP